MQKLNTELLSISLSKTQKGGNEESDHVSSIGPKVKMETDMHGLLRLSCFRKELFSFFFKEIEGQIYAAIIVSKLLYIAIDKKRKKFFSITGKLYWRCLDQICGYQLKADTHIPFHVKHSDINNPGEIVVHPIIQIDI